MTAAASLSRLGWETARSVRQRLTRLSPTERLLGGLVALTIAIHGFRLLLPLYPRGDLLYHWGLANAVLRGEIPPGGPYEGLPAYYPPGFHVLLALGSRLTGLDLVPLTLLLSMLWLPVLPIATYLLARRLTGRPWVALLAAALTVFGGGYDFSPDRLWVNSWFMIGHEAIPLYPRDIVFGLLPLAFLAFLRSFDEPTRWLRWSGAGGLLLGLCALTQVQLLLPIPFALGATAIAIALRDPARRRRALTSLVVVGGLAMALVAPWFAITVEAIRRNGGVALDSSENLVPARIGFWNYPVQFGLILPLAIVGIGVALLLLRRPDGPRPGGVPAGPWRPTPIEGPLLLVAWLVVPFALAILYNPGWPLEDALRPQRLWLLSGQPALILAAIGLAVVVEDVVLGWRRDRFVVPMIVGVALAIAIPATFATTRLLATTWTEEEYSHLRPGPDRVPDFERLLGTSGPRRTVLTYEDWSSLVWYETGLWVVAVEPPGYAKLAFDPTIFTGRGQLDRRAAVARAFRGDPAVIAGLAGEFGADQIVLAARDGRWGTIDVVASQAIAAGSYGAATRLGNGWDLVEFAPGARVSAPLATTGREIRLELRFEGERNNRPVPARRFRLLAAEGPSQRLLGEHLVPDSGLAEWQIVGATATLEEGESLVVEAVDPLVLQSFRGFTADVGPPPGWRVATESADAIVLERLP